jgi:hypothetical protein
MERKESRFRLGSAADFVAVLCYFAVALLGYGLTSLSPWLTADAILAEGSLVVWLLVMGIEVDRWKETRS